MCHRGYHSAGKMLQTRAKHFHTESTPGVSAYHNQHGARDLLVPPELHSKSSPSPEIFILLDTSELLLKSLYLFSLFPRKEHQRASYSIPPCYTLRRTPSVLKSLFKGCRSLKQKFRSLPKRQHNYILIGHLAITLHVRN